MTESSSASAAQAPVSPQDVRRPTLDAIDRRIMRLLHSDGRMPNSTLATAAGIAPSTCLARVRALRQSGVIRGFHADIDPAAVGRGLNAMISVRMAPGSRHGLTPFARGLAARPEVLNVFFLAGADDYLVHVAVRDTAELRAFVVEQLSEQPEVAGTETSLIFDHLPGTADPS